MNILIIDDDLSFIEQIEKDISTFFKNKNININVTCYDHNFKDILIQNNYNIVILDINLQSVNGIQIGRKIREVNPLAHIIFTSSEENYVFQTFEIRPFYFLRKAYYSIDFNNMTKLLNKHIKEDTVLTLTSRSSKTYVSINSILYIEAFRHVLHIHTTDDIFYDNSTLETFIAKLPSDTFVQVQRSFVVNMDYIKTLNTNNIVLVNNTNIPIGRKYKDLLLNNYQEYLIKS